MTGRQKTKQIIFVIDDKCHIWSSLLHIITIVCGILITRQTYCLHTQDESHFLSGYDSGLVWRSNEGKGCTLAFLEGRRGDALDQLSFCWACKVWTWTLNTNPSVLISKFPASLDFASFHERVGLGLGLACIMHMKIKVCLPFVITFFISLLNLSLNNDKIWPEWLQIINGAHRGQ